MCVEPTVTLPDLSASVTPGSEPQDSNNRTKEKQRSWAGGLVCNRGLAVSTWQWATACSYPHPNARAGVLPAVDTGRGLLAPRGAARPDSACCTVGSHLNEGPRTFLEAEWRPQTCHLCSLVGDSGVFLARSTGKQNLRAVKEALVTCTRP